MTFKWPPGILLPSLECCQTSFVFLRMPRLLITNYNVTLIISLSRCSNCVSTFNRVQFLPSRHIRTVKLWISDDSIDYTSIRYFEIMRDLVRKRICLDTLTTKLKGLKNLENRETRGVLKRNSSKLLYDSFSPSSRSFQCRRFFID